MDSPVLPTPLAPTTAILTSRRPAAPRQQSAAVLPGAGYSAMVHMFWMRRIAATARLHGAGLESQDRRRLALQGEEGTRSEGTRAETGKNGRARREERLSGSGSRLGSQPPGRGFSLAQAPPPPQQPIRGRPARGPAHGLHNQAAPPQEPRASAGPCEIRGKQGGRREGGNVRDPAGSRCASTRPHRCLRGHGVSDPRGGDLAVSAGSQVHVVGICPCLQRSPGVSAGSQIRGGFRGTHPCLPTSPLGLRRSVPRHSLNWVPGPLTSLTTAYIPLASPPLTPRNLLGAP